MLRRSGRVRFELFMPGALILGGLSLPMSCGRVGYDPSGPSKRAVDRGGDASTNVVDSGNGGFPAEDGASIGDGGALFGAGGAAGNPGSGGSSGKSSPSGGSSGTTTGSGGAPALDSGVVADAALPDAARGCRFTPQALADWCTEVPELPAPAVIDGELDCGLVARPITPVAYNLMGTPDATIDYAVAWSAEGLYFYAAVHDPVVLPAPSGDPPWEGDGLELYVDSDGVYGAPPAYDAATRQVIIAAPAGSMPSARAETYAVPPTGVTWTSTRFEAFPRPDGYVIEAVVSAADLGLSTWALTAGSHVGFDVGLNVSGPNADAGTQGTRIGQYFLRVDPSVTGHPFQNVAAFCNPTLVAR